MKMWQKSSGSNWPKCSKLEKWIPFLEFIIVFVFTDFFRPGQIDPVCTGPEFLLNQTSLSLYFIFFSFRAQSFSFTLFPGNVIVWHDLRESPVNRVKKLKSSHAACSKWNSSLYLSLCTTMEFTWSRFFLTPSCSLVGIRRKGIYRDNDFRCEMSTSHVRNVLVSPGTRRHPFPKKQRSPLLRHQWIHIFTLLCARYTRTTTFRHYQRANCKFLAIFTHFRIYSQN